MKTYLNTTHNRVSKINKKYRIILDMMWSMMSYVDLSSSFYGYTLQTTTYLLKRVLIKSVDKTPYEI
jgi:hypothetical protein